MSFVKIQKITTEEAWIIRGLLIGSITFAFLITKFYPFDILRWFFPDQFRYESSCIILNFLGIPCPFCGMSHSLGEYIKFNFSGSIYYNPSSVIFFTFLGLICLSIFILSLVNYKISVSFNKTTIILFISAFLIIWVLNICFGHLN